MVRSAASAPVRGARVTAVIGAASLFCPTIRVTLGFIRGTPDKINGQQTVLSQCDRAGAVMLARFAFILSVATISPAIALEPVSLYAAGSLRGALTEVAGAFEAVSGQRVQAKYGPSGTLKDEIAGG